MKEKIPHIEQYLKHLADTWALTIEELNDIREHMAAYAVDCLMDSDVAREAVKINEESL